MMKYYSSFKMRFTTSNFTTDWHSLEVGIAAGCTISVIWFILVMEIILLSTRFGEDRANVRSLIKAFMDDVTLLTRKKTAMESVMVDLNGLISWARMKFKPKKSRSLTFKKGRQVQTRFHIGNEKIPTVKEKPVKSLGRLYAGSLTDRHQGIVIQKQAEDGLKAITKTKLPGKFEVWCLQFGLYPRLSWPLVIYDVALTRVEAMERMCNIHIRKWLGLPKMHNTASLYRSRGSFQLPITSIVEIYKTGKVRTVMMLRESNDASIRQLPPRVRTARKWKAEEETDRAVAVMEHKDIVGYTQCGRAGLGSTSFKPFSKMNQKERRLAVTDQVKHQEAEQREVQLIQHSVQGQIKRWEEFVVERKVSWNEMWSWSASRMSFLLRSTFDTLPSPRNLVRWKLSDDDQCKCGKTATMKHVLSNCGLALRRYEWRHNEVLKIIFEEVQRHIEKSNSGDKPQKNHPGRSIQFVRAGRGITNPLRKKTIDDGRWSGEWKIAADLPGAKKSFPIPTSKRPDIFLWSDDQKMLELVELTVPFEDNIEAARARKNERYEHLTNQCIEDGWDTWHSPVEVGCRGYVGVKTRQWFLSLGFPHKKTNLLMKRIQETVEKASHWIWIKRDDESWFE